MLSDIIVAWYSRRGLGMDHSRGVVDSLRRGQVINVTSRWGKTMENTHRGGGTVGDLGRLTFGITAFLKTCNRSSVLNTGPGTGHEDA